MSDPENTPEEQRTDAGDAPEPTSAEAETTHQKTPRPVTVEDVTDDERGHSDSVSMTTLQVASPPISPSVLSASVSPRPAPATVGPATGLPSPEEESHFDHRMQDPPWVSPRPQRRFGGQAPGPRDHLPHHDPHHQQHPHQSNLQQLQPLNTQAEVFRYLDHPGPPNMLPEQPRRHPRRAKGPPSSISSDRASSPSVLRSPMLAPAHNSFPNGRFSPGQGRPPPSEITNWGPPEYWAESDHPPPFQNLSSPTFPPGPGRPPVAGPGGFPQPPPFGGPGGGGPKHFPPPSYAPPRPRPRSRQQQPPPNEFEQFHQPPPFIPPHGHDNGEMTGYKYLTEKLGGSVFGPPITPIYRKFEAMGHRILLQLQDELCQLEEKLDKIDSFESSTRLSQGFRPASARAAAADDHPVAQERLEILNEISKQLDMYYQFLKLFKDAQCLSKPAMNEVEAYRNFLDSGAHIVEEETRFLGRTSDLLSLPAAEPMPDELRVGGRLLLRDRDSETSTPTPGDTSRRGSLMPAPSPRTEHQQHAGRPHPRGTNKEHRAAAAAAAALGAHPQLPMYFACGILAAVLVPVMSFPIFQGFAERLVVIVLVFAGVAAVLWQAGLGEMRRPLDAALCTGAYVVMMSAAAIICH